MKNRVKKDRNLAILFSVLYVVYIVCLFWFHPIVASAAGTDSGTKKVPGGKGNTVVFNSVVTMQKGKNKNTYSATLKAGSDYEIVGCISEMGNVEVDGWYDVYFRVVKTDGTLASLGKNNLADCTGVEMNYRDGVLQRSAAYSLSDVIPGSVMYKSINDHQTVTCMISGCKIFTDSEGMAAYAKSGSLDGMLKDAELDKTWYLKDIRCKVTADDSPSGSGGEEATYISFNWLTDNLKDGDVIEIKTHNYLKKIGGDKISGFHDFITYDHNVSALGNPFTDNSGNKRASYTIGQRDAVNAWLNTLENKPLIFKTYETDIYYFRPYRNGKVGAWCKVAMNRHGETGSPYIEDVEIGDIDDDGDWIPDDEETDKNGGNHGVDQGGNITYPNPDNPFEGTNLAGIFEYFYNFFRSLPSLFGDLPALVNSVIGFLPSAVIGFIAIGIVVVIFLRIVGR